MFPDSLFFNKNIAKKLIYITKIFLDKKWTMMKV